MPDAIVAFGLFSACMAGKASEMDKTAAQPRHGRDVVCKRPAAASATAKRPAAVGAGRRAAAGTKRRAAVKKKVKASGKAKLVGKSAESACEKPQRKAPNALRVARVGACKVGSPFRIASDCSGWCTEVRAAKMVLPEGTPLHHVFASDKNKHVRCPDASENTISSVACVFVFVRVFAFGFVLAFVFVFLFVPLCVCLRSCARLCSCSCGCVCVCACVCVCVCV